MFEFSTNSQNLNESLEKVYNWYVENQKENFKPNENKKQMLIRNSNKAMVIMLYLNKWLLTIFVKTFIKDCKFFYSF